MFSAILDVALGIILLYLILSLIASAVNELISARFQSRARNLEFFVMCLLFEGVQAPLATYRVVVQRIQARWRQLLGRPAVAATDESRHAMANNFVNAPLLFAQVGEGKFPNYIKAEDFAQAVFDFVRDQYKRGQMVGQQAAATAATTAAAATPATPTAAASAPIVPPPQDANQGAVGGGGNPTPPSPNAGQPAAIPTSITTQTIEAIPSDDAFDFNSLSDAVTALPPDMPLKRVLSSIILRVKEDVPPEKRKVDIVRAALMKWYDNSMDRVSGWYKRDVQINLLIIGALLVVALNIDTLSIANRLLQNPALREAVSARAQTVAQQVVLQPALQSAVLTATTVANAVAQYGSTATALSVTPVAPAATPGALAGTPTGSAVAGGAETVPPVPPALVPLASGNYGDLNQYIGSLATLQGQLNQLDVPIGWGEVDNYPSPARPFGDFLAWWFKKIVGLIVTVLAIIQGAPFWFDLLNKVTNLRAAGKPPEKADSAAG